MEIIRKPGHPRFRVAMFDFDGTLSLLREGWPAVMLDLELEQFDGLAPCRGHLARAIDGDARAGCPRHSRARRPRHSRDSLRAMLQQDIDELTGEQTIYQMIRLAQRVRELGGSPRDPAEYKAEFVRRMSDHIAQRRQAVASGAAPADRMLLAGAAEFLHALANRGLLLCLASGTDEPYVRDEAALLGVAEFFGPHIYGARDNYEASGKQRVIDRLLRDTGVAGEEFVVFGDGYVEIACARAVGGYAIGVASDEIAGGGKINPWKRERLVAAGANVIVPDFAEGAGLVRLLFERRQ